MSKYAENTEVPVDRSKSEIERILTRYGADEFMYGTKRDKAVIAFKAHNKHVRFVLPLPNPDDFTETPTGRERARGVQEKAWEQEMRRRWRALALSIKGKLESVETGIMSFEYEFLAHIVLPNGETVAEYMIPQLEEAYRTGKMPKMLPMLQ